jgi:acetyltransferase-like isoleucine patch superfamily enzyme
MISKITAYFQAYSLFDFVRKFTYKTILLTRILNLKLFKKIYYFKSTNFVLGNNVITDGFSTNVSIGKDTNIYDRCVFVLSNHQAALKIGERCILSYGVLVACNQHISIGNHVMIGEYTSVRDTTHNYDNTNLPMILSGDHSSPVTIGSDVWIGRGCIILPGTTIENGTVIGANCVVRGHLEGNAVYAGNPIKKIKNRT